MIVEDSNAGYDFLTQSEKNPGYYVKVLVENPIFFQN